MAKQDISDAAGSAGEELLACPCCGLIHRCPPLAHDERALCQRCASVLVHGARRRDNRPAACAALAALILYLPAVTMPIMRLEKLGLVQESSVLGGGIQLLHHGEWLVGGVVLLCSVVIPLGKLGALFLLSAGPRLRARHLATTYRLVEHVGRWGMIDVLLVAVVVASLKLGDLVSVSPGPAALLFTCMVIFSLLSAAWFDPRVLWADHAQQPSTARHD